MTKREKYHQLIADVREDYLHRPVAQTSGGPKLLWCEDCKQEINLWTYWQNSLDAKIMLVGQDWGCPCDEASKTTMHRIRQVNDGGIEQFFPNLSGKNVNPTDGNLKELFRVLGYDLKTKEPDLFFTNFILGYRDHGTSGGFRQQWVRDDAPYFKRLAEIIEPETIICLGKNTFEGVMFGLTGKTERVRGFNRFLDSGENRRTVSLSSGKPASVYAVAHWGTIGTMNRNRGKKAEDGSNLSSKEIAVQKRDWERIKANGIQKK